MALFIHLYSHSCSPHTHLRVLANSYAKKTSCEKRGQIAGFLSAGFIHRKLNTASRTTMHSQPYFLQQNLSLLLLSCSTLSWIFIVECWYIILTLTLESSIDFGHLTGRRMNNVRGNFPWKPDADVHILHLFTSIEDLQSSPSEATLLSLIQMTSPLDNDVCKLPFLNVCCGEIWH